MMLKLSDIETNAVRHALESYRVNLEKAEQEKGVRLEEDAVESVIKKITSASGAPGT